MLREHRRHGISARYNRRRCARHVALREWHWPDTTALRQTFRPTSTRRCDDRPQRRSFRATPPINAPTRPAPHPCDNQRDKNGGKFHSADNPASRCPARARRIKSVMRSISSSLSAASPSKSREIVDETRFRLFRHEIHEFSEHGISRGKQFGVIARATLVPFTERLPILAIPSRAKNVAFGGENEVRTNR